MYLPSTKVAEELQGEVRALETSHAALQTAVARAEADRTATEADLAHLLRRLATKTAEALPGDDAIRKRLDTAIGSAFTDARTALLARWDQIIELLNGASTKVQEELTVKKADLRLALDKAAHDQQQERLAAR